MVRDAREGRAPHHEELVDRPDQVLDLFRMWPELLCELVEKGIGQRCKTLLVDVLDNLDAKTLQLGCRGLFELEGPRRLLGADFGSSRLHPLLLVGGKALPQFVADE